MSDDPAWNFADEEPMDLSGLDQWRALYEQKPEPPIRCETIVDGAQCIGAHEHQGEHVNHEGNATLGDLGFRDPFSRRGDKF